MIPNLKASKTMMRFALKSSSIPKLIELIQPQEILVHRTVAESHYL